MATRSLLHSPHSKILIRSTNWIGDAIMTLPAVRTIRKNFPGAEISILSQPWVADVFRADPAIDHVVHYYKKTKHQGLAGIYRMGRELSLHRFDMAILLQNAFEAALIARIARIPVVAGYSRDCRRPLLTHAVPQNREIRQKHQVYYYQHLMRELGLECGPDELHLHLADDDIAWARNFLAGHPRPLVGLNPGAAYGPAKRWPAKRYGELAKLVQLQTGGSVAVFGTRDDTAAAEEIATFAPGLIDLTGRTTLSQAMAIISLCDAFVTNDSGLMHVAAATATPLVAIFGSTDPIATGPFSAQAIVIQKHLPCIPCLKPDCTTDFACMQGIRAGEVFEAVSSLLAGGARKNTAHPAMETGKSEK